MRFGVWLIGLIVLDTLAWLWLGWAGVAVFTAAVFYGGWIEP